MTNPAPGTASFAGTNFWNIEWLGSGQIFHPGVDFTRTDNPWTEALLSDLRVYRVLRFMDWNDSNAAETPQAHVASRERKQSSQRQRVALEWQIDLCNRIAADCWINFHLTSGTADWQEAAELIRSTLKPSLRVYVEWSNEVWNEAFPQARAAREQAQQLRLPGENASAAAQVHASVRLFEQFETTFAAERQRLVKVLAGQAAWTGPCDAQRAALADERINPRGTRPDVFAIAPYLMGGSVEELRASLDTVRDWTRSNAACARKIGVPLISYEGGNDSFAAGDRCIELQRNPAIRGIYTDYLRAISDAGMSGPFMQYTHSGPCWGLKLQTGDPAQQSPKWQGLMDWLAQVDPREESRP